MQRKVVNVSLFLIICIILVACGPSEAERTAQVTTIAASIFATQTAQAPAPTSTPTITPTALPSAPAMALLTNVDEGFYVRFPAQYHAVLYGSSMCLSLISHHGPPGPCHSPSAFIDVSDAAGRSASQVADALLADYPAIDIGRSSLTIADEEAVVLDNVPGQATSRKVLIVHADRLYTLTFIVPPDENGNPDFEQMEGLYIEVIGSFGFLRNE